MRSKAEKIANSAHRDFEFIGRQILRFLRMSPKERISHFKLNRTDALCSIPHPGRGGLVICGRLAWHRFGDVADKVIEAHPSLAGRVTRENVKKEVVDAYVRRLRQSKNLDVRGARNLLRAVARKSKKSLKTLDHYIPCVFFLHGGPDEFALGPVTFVRTQKFFRDRKASLRRGAERDELRHIRQVNAAVRRGVSRKHTVKPSGSRKFVRDIRAAAIKIYRGYPWVACVKVERCDLETSKRLAMRAADAALNVTRIFLGAEHTRQVRLASSRGDVIRGAALWGDETGAIYVGLTSRSMAPVGFENWFDALKQGGRLDLIVFGSAVKYLASVNTPPLLAARFVDAINWFGDAATDPEPAASVVKYVSAIERLLFKEYERGRRAAFANRVQALLRAFGYAESARMFNEAHKIYDIRSALLHGATSPRDAQMAELALIAERIARECLFCASQLFPMMARVYKRPAEKLDVLLQDLDHDGLDKIADIAGYKRSTSLPSG